MIVIVVVIGNVLILIAVAVEIVVNTVICEVPGVLHWSTGVLHTRPAQEPIA